MALLILLCRSVGIVGVFHSPDASFGHVTFHIILAFETYLLRLFATESVAYLLALRPLGTPAVAFI